MAIADVAPKAPAQLVGQLADGIDETAELEEDVVPALESRLGEVPALEQTAAAEELGVRRAGLGWQGSILLPGGSVVAVLCKIMI